MDDIKIETFCIGDFSTNCYLVYDLPTKEGFLVDPGGVSEELDSFIKKREIDIQFIVLTHGHIDHIKGVEHFDLPYYIHKDDEIFLKTPSYNLSFYFYEPITLNRLPLLLKDNDKLYLGDKEWVVLHTPGHTPGSISLKYGKVVIVGDLIFAGSIGRTDLPFGSFEQIIDSIRTKIFVLDDDTQILPGHGPTTTVGKEKKDNPFLKS